MIKINLTPIEELENKHWYIPDLLVLLTIATGAYSGVQFYLQQIQSEINRTNDERIDLEKSYRRLKPDLDRFTQLNKENEQLRRKLNSLKQITISKIARYKPIILLEHLQNLKPEGVWFDQYNDISKESIIKISGRSFDNLLVAEFIAALGSTRLNEIDTSDIRSQVFFSGLHLEKVSTSDAIDVAEEQNADPLNQAFQSTQDHRLTENSIGNTHNTGSNMFPELEKFPRFELNIRYEERGSFETESLSK